MPKRLDQSVEITFFIKDNGLLTRTVHCGADGSTVIDSSEFRMSRGKMERVLLADWRQLDESISNLPSDTAIALGRMRPDVLDKVYLTTTRMRRIARTLVSPREPATIYYMRLGEPAFVLLDFETKGMPPAVKARLAKLGGFLEALRRHRGRAFSKTSSCARLAGSIGLVPCRRRWAIA